MEFFEFVAPYYSMIGASSEREALGQYCIEYDIEDGQKIAYSCISEAVARTCYQSFLSHFVSSDEVVQRSKSAFNLMKQEDSPVLIAEH